MRLEPTRGVRRIETEGEPFSCLLSFRRRVISLQMIPIGALLGAWQRQDIPIEIIGDDVPTSLSGIVQAIRIIIILSRSTDKESLTEKLLK